MFSTQSFLVDEHFGIMFPLIGHVSVVRIVKARKHDLWALGNPFRHQTTGCHIIVVRNLRPLSSNG